MLLKKLSTVILIGIVVWTTAFAASDDTLLYNSERIYCMVHDNYDIEIFLPDNTYVIDPSGLETRIVIEDSRVEPTITLKSAIVTNEGSILISLNNFGDGYAVDIKIAPNALADKNGVFINVLYWASASTHVHEGITDIPTTYVKPLFELQDNQITLRFNRGFYYANISDGIKVTKNGLQLIFDSDYIIPWDSELAIHYNELHIQFAIPIETTDRIKIKILPGAFVVNSNTNTITMDLPTDTSGYQFQIDNHYFVAKGKLLEIDPERATSPKIYNDRTILPIRSFVEAIGGAIWWDETESKVTMEYQGRNIELWIGHKEARINGDSILLDVAPIVINDRTMIPLRFVSEAVGFDVTWDGSNSIVNIKG